MSSVLIVRFLMCGEAKFAVEIPMRSFKRSRIWLKVALRRLS